MALILVDRQGENLISVASGANHALSPQDVEKAAERIRAAARAYNLQTGEPNTFFAAGFAVHNKGGGGFSHSHSHGGAGGSSDGGGASMLG